jgi:inner membrane protein
MGAALAECGLKKHTAYATPTLIIAANLPDIDVLAIPFGHGIDFRRGYTHGLVALIILPILLAFFMRWWSRRRGSAGFDFRATIALAAVGIATHPFLDGMNTYGVRWLMPFSDRWYSAESLFIIDLFLWGVLGAGWWWGNRLSRQGAAHPERPARIAIVAAGLYVIAMISASEWTRRTVLGYARATGGAVPVSQLLVSPRPFSPLTRDLVVRIGDQYQFGEAKVFSRDWTIYHHALPLHSDHPAAVAAARTPEGRKFLVWSQLPYYTIAEGLRSASVRLDDARYSTGQPSFAAVFVEVPRRPDGSYGEP